MQVDDTADEPFGLIHYDYAFDTSNISKIPVSSFRAVRKEKREGTKSCLVDLGISILQEKNETLYRRREARSSGWRHIFIMGD